MRQLLLLIFLQLWMFCGCHTVIDSEPQKRFLIEPDTYDAMRATFLNESLNRSFGNDLTLSQLESEANEVLMSYKMQEIKDGFLNVPVFAPGLHIFEAYELINQSKVFEMIKTMPKGGVLHAHDIAMLSPKKFIELTYKPHLWILGDIAERPEFLFSEKRPKKKGDLRWRLVSSVRAGDPHFDQYLERKLTLVVKDPLHEYTDINEVWNKFMCIFSLVAPIVTYEEVWKEYYFETLKEYLDDGVQYLEFRGTLPQVYSLNGSTYSPIETIQMQVEVLENFKQLHVDFIDSKFIYAPIRNVEPEWIDTYRSTFLEIQSKFPNFVVGFDLVGQEDKGKTLKEFSHKLLEFPADTNFYFHAGETDWNGETDENLVDAILLGTKRIGHGYGIIKNPRALEEIKLRDICIEINPISNQVLKLLNDIRNHPGAVLFSDNYPVVVSSDDPGYWGALPLSHDFYFAFMGMASTHSDLRFLKKLALNSIKYSAMNDQEKEVAVKKWSVKWNKWLQWVIQFRQ